MISFFKARRLKEYKTEARSYVSKVYHIPTVHEMYAAAKAASPQTETRDSGNKFSERDSGVLFSDRNIPSEISSKDGYDAAVVSKAMNIFNRNTDTAMLSRILNSTVSCSFSECLTIYIQKSGKRDSTIYKSAQVDRRLYSKIISDKNYQPSKDTALAFIFALRLSLAESSDLLSRAGYTLSHSNKRDVILEYFISNRISDLNDINAVLYDLGEKTIGR